MTSAAVHLPGGLRGLLGALLAGLAACSSPAAPARTTASDGAFSAPSPDPCATRPAHDPICARGIQASGNATCLYSDHQVECFGPGIPNERLEFALPPGPEIDRSAFQERFFCALRAGRPQCFFFASQRWESPGDLTADDIHAAPDRQAICLRTGRSSTCYPVTAEGFVPGAPILAGELSRCGRGVLACAGERLRGAVYGGQHGCALREDEVVCWGDNEQGQLGVPASWTQQRERTLPDLGKIRMLAAGQAHTCALRAGGEVLCWGRFHPALFPGAEPLSEPRLVALTTAFDAHVALSDAGKIFVLEQDAGLSEPDLPAPVRQIRGPLWVLRDGRLLRFAREASSGRGVVLPISLSAPVAELWPGVDCARLTSGEVECWDLPGQTHFTKLARWGDHVPPADTGFAPPVPRPVRLFEVENAPGGSSRCAVDEAGTLLCWGDLEYHWTEEVRVWEGNKIAWVWSETRRGPVPLAGRRRIVDSTPSGCLLDDRGQLHRPDYLCRHGRCALRLFSSPPGQKVVSIRPGRTCAGASGSGAILSTEEPRNRIADRFGSHIPPARTLDPDLQLPSPAPPPVGLSSTSFGVTCRALEASGLRCRSDMPERHETSETNPLVSHLPRRLFSGP